ncbi:general transcription factor IIH subunit 3-like isoform X2 [Paramormyrops kingsleyae]|uniref:general transcription factor IIH subunit 3-like isoform X2 n=1 Tax=Paramormyrops kingsleyae TaxID=1676925 RepID=UPI003B96E2E4
MASEDEISLLVIVIDVNPIWWGQQAQREPEFTLSKCLDAVMVMGNSHLVMNRTNKLAIIASHCQESHFLYPSKHWKAGDMTGDDSGLGSGDGKYELLSVANDLIAEEVRRLMARTKISGHQTDTMLAGSLAKALCYIHRLTKELDAQDMKSRILVNAFLNLCFPKGGCLLVNTITSVPAPCFVCELGLFSPHFCTFPLVISVSSYNPKT